MSRLVVALTVAVLAAASTSVTTSGSAGGTTVVTESPSHEHPSNSCPPQGCRIPDCGNDQVVHVSVDVGPDAVGTQNVEQDLQAWIQQLVGQGEGQGIPT